MSRCYYYIGWVYILSIIGCASHRPYVRIVAPFDGARVAGTFDVTAQVTGEDIARVEFYVDGEFHALAMHPPYAVPWATYTLPDSSRHILTAKVYDRSDHAAASDPVSVLIENSQDRPMNRLHLIAARVNNSELDSADPMVEVHPGDDIAGDITVRAVNYGDPLWGAPLGGTPTWGDHIEQYWETGIWLPPGESEHTIDLFLQAPEDTGRYFIFIAWGHEADCSHVMALSYWRYEDSPEWNDGHDLADWREEQADMAIDSGYVRSEYRYDRSGYGIKHVPAVAIRVNVIGDREREP